MATSSSSRCICLGFSAPSREPDLASLPDPLRLLAPPNAPDPLESAWTKKSVSQEQDKQDLVE